MKTVLLLFAATAIYGAEKSGPKPIPNDRQEAISRVMLSAQQAQSNAAAATKAAQDKFEEYKAMLTKLQKEFGAEGCDLTLDKQWSCPNPITAAK